MEKRHELYLLALAAIVLSLLMAMGTPSGGQGTNKNVAAYEQALKDGIPVLVDVSVPT